MGERQELIEIKEDGNIKGEVGVGSAVRRTKAQIGGVAIVPSAQGELKFGVSHMWGSRSKNA